MLPALYVRLAAGPPPGVYDAYVRVGYDIQTAPRRACSLPCAEGLGICLFVGKILPDT